MSLDECIDFEARLISRHPTGFGHQSLSMMKLISKYIQNIPFHSLASINNKSSLADVVAGACFSFLLLLLFFFFERIRSKEREKIQVERYTYVNAKKLPRAETVWYRTDMPWQAVVFLLVCLRVDPRSFDQRDETLSERTEDLHAGQRRRERERMSPRRNIYFD